VITKFQTFLNNLWKMAKRHPFLTSVLVALCLLFIGFAFLVGFIQMAVLLAPIALIAWWMIQKRNPQQGRAEALNIMSSVAIATVAIFAVIQAIPYGRNHTNPPVTGEPKWANPETRDLMVRACFGCHSNEVKYPSYANVAPISWAVQNHIDEGRSTVNYSEFSINSEGADDTIEVIQEGSMPPGFYTRFGRHPEARLTSAEIAILIAGLKATPGFSEGH
jgi:hypothetical protein